MKKFLLLSGLLIALAGGAAVFYAFKQTKSHSPETTAEYKEKGLRVSVFYNRPYKKGRVIFGGLVPYGKTWRTGANEATVFRTSKDLVIDNKILPAGSYSLWTVPNEQSWSVVFNSAIPNWGIDVMKNGEAARDSLTDVIVVDAPVVITQKEFEQFTISIEKADDILELVLAWDKTLVAVPLQVKE